MKINYKPKTELEKFGEKIYNLLVDNFPQTFFVGGMVRDILLDRKVTDIDIATSATPDEIIATLAERGIKYDDKNKKFGSIVAKQGSVNIEVTTLRKDLPGHNRYNKVVFIKNPKTDSERRDFTINSLYLKPLRGLPSDFQHGLEDLENKTIRFIGTPERRIKNDPLRIIRALRFCLVLNFKLDAAAKMAIKNNFFEIKKLTKTKIEKEILKLKNKKLESLLRKVINNPAYIDKYFK